jgi:hypothetical protein
MTMFKAVFLVLCLFQLACGSEPRGPKTPSLEAAFSHLPMPPNPELVSQSGSADALQLTLYSSANLEAVTEYYRKMLGSGNWRLVSDNKIADGSVVLYAEQDGPPMWVRIWKPSDRAGTLVQLTGAVVAKDSVQKDARQTRSRTQKPR